MVGDDVDLTKFPWPRWHQRDGGPYICATAAVTRDPDSGYINVGSYRYMLLGKNCIVAHIGSGHHGDVIRKKYWAKGQSCPVAISLGQEPALFETAGTNLSWGVSEYGFAGWMRGAPVEVIKGVTTDLPIPATAEVVLEGEMLPPDEGTQIEGPFGEMSGYYGGGARPAPVTVIKSVLYRNDPIILGAPPFLGASRGILWRQLLVGHDDHFHQASLSRPRHARGARGVGRHRRLSRPVRYRRRRRYRSLRSRRRHVGAGDALRSGDFARRVPQDLELQDRSALAEAQKRSR